MRCFQNGSDILCSGVGHVISKLDFGISGARCTKIVLISPHELKKENNCAQLSNFRKF